MISKNIDVLALIVLVLGFGLYTKANDTGALQLLQCKWDMSSPRVVPAIDWRELPTLNCLFN